MNKEPPVKKQRGVNFTANEKNVLVDLVSTRKAVIENKQTDGVTVREKEAAWQSLASEFNAYSNVTKRSWNQLKLCYENLKKRTKKKCCVGQGADQQDRRRHFQVAYRRHWK